MRELVVRWCSLVVGNLLFNLVLRGWKSLNKREGSFFWRIGTPFVALKEFQKENPQRGVVRQIAESYWGFHL